MKTVYKGIKNSVKKGERLLAILIDPDKFQLKNTEKFIEKVNASIATHIFVGGSFVDNFKTEKLVVEIKRHTNLPVVLFPGDTNQITGEAQAILFMSLISGDNPDYLIAKQVEAVPLLKKLNLEIIPTGYILIENGRPTEVEKVTHTNPMAKNGIEKICNTAKAGEYLGMKLIYLEAGSGAVNPVNLKIIKFVKNDLNIPLLVGGGIRSRKQIEDTYQAGADLVILGTILEENESFFEELLN